MIYLEPWWSTASQNATFHEAFNRQLQLELAAGHPLHGLPTQLIARGNGDDALFQITDGSGRVAEVHLTWSTRTERLPWPITCIYDSLDDWASGSMYPEHRRWSGEGQ